MHFRHRETRKRLYKENNMWLKIKSFFKTVYEVIEEVQLRRAQQYLKNNVKNY
jgi:hypothetical protein